MTQLDPERDPIVHDILQRFTTEHLSDAEITSYHDNRIQDALTSARVQAHLARCLICEERLMLWQEIMAETAVMSPAATLGRLQPSATGVPAWESATLRAPRRTVWQRLQAAMQQVEEYLTIPVPYGLAPAHARQYATGRPKLPLAVESAMLAGLIEPLRDGGALLTVSSELEAYAGRMLEFVCTAQDTQAILLRGFSVLPAAPNEALYFESVVHVSSEDTIKLAMPVQVHVYPVDPGDLTEDDVATLDWSLHQADNEASQDAWRALCQQLQGENSVHPALRAWATQQVA